MKWIWKQSSQRKKNNNQNVTCTTVEVDIFHFRPALQTSFHICQEREACLQKTFHLAKTRVGAVTKQSAIKTRDSTAISKSTSHNKRYEQEFVHILQISEVWSQLANTFGGEASGWGTPSQHWGENLPEGIHARKIQQQTLSEPQFPEIRLYYVACKYRIKNQNKL